MADMTADLNAPASPLPALATSEEPTVCAVLVAYYANLALLETALAALMPQVQGLVIVNHGGQPPEFAALMAKARARGAAVLQHQDNPGLASGFNRGIEYARAQGFEFVLLLDQDSLLAPDMVPVLLEHYRQLSRAAPIAAVGPQFTDPRTEIKAPFVRFGFPLNHKIHSAAGGVVACDFLISSGSLIPLAVLDAVGMMDESLFIDNIDMEWCMRAHASGYTLYGIFAASMRHTIGKQVTSRNWWCGRTFVHDPQRLYYSTRNRVWLYHRAHTPWLWVVQDIPRLLLRFARMSLLVAPRRAHARAMLRGLWDGLRGGGANKC